MKQEEINLGFDSNAAINRNNNQENELVNQFMEKEGTGLNLNSDKDLEKKLANQFTKKEELDRENELVNELVNQSNESLETQKIDPFAKGRERLASIGEFFSHTKDKAISLFKKIGGALSRFGSKAKSFGIDVLAATLSADVLAKKGYEFASDKVGEAKEFVSEFVGSNYDKARDFTQNKTNQVKEFSQDKVEMAKDLAFYTAGKTKEGLEKVGHGIENRYNKIKTFAENAFAAAKLEVAKIKDAYRQKMNAIRLNRLTAEHEKILQEEQKASEKAEKLRLKRESLLEKIGLLQSVENAS